MRTQLRADVRSILRDARQSAIFVTHDQAEALTIADRVAVMARGRLLQTAAPELIYAEPATPFVATFIGVANLVHAVVADGVARTRFGPVALVGPDARRLAGPSLCLLRPEHFTLDEATGGDGSGAWEVVGRRFSGSEILLEARSPDGDRMWVEAGDRVRHVGPGDRVTLGLRQVETVAFPRTGGEHGRPGPDPTLGP
jgi:ABC-type Fe3+/spermidine/putrescine transport system ATPase subunit